MNESSLMLAIFHLKRDSTRRTHFPPLPWPQDDGDDSLIFTPIISPAINANRMSGFSHPCLLLWLTWSCWEQTEHPSPRSLESRRAETRIKARHISDRSPPQPHATQKPLHRGQQGRMATGHGQLEPSILADKCRLRCCWRGMSQTHLAVGLRDAPLGAHCGHW